MTKCSTDFEILDCTLRDGGYYNKWQFPLSVVRAHLSAAFEANVEHVELGFRFLECKNSYGPNAMSSKEYISSLGEFDQKSICVMSNASDLLKTVDNEKSYKKLYPSIDKDSINFVRIASHIHQYEALQDPINYLLDSGYKVALNLMQITEHDENQITEFVGFSNKFDLEAVYFADSLGALSPDRVSDISRIFRSNSRNKFGIHAHDNCGLALHNSMIAVDNGASIVDASLTGMGRGPGNTILEELLLERSSISSKSVNMDEYVDLIDDYYLPLKSTHAWGKNMYYYQAAKRKVHPTYVQEMLSYSDMSRSQILKSIDKISNFSKPTSFSNVELWNALIPNSDYPVGNFPAVFRGRNVLILGPSKSLVDAKEELETFCGRNNVLVVGLNAHSSPLDDKLDFRCFCSPLRELSELAECTTPTISPYSNDNPRSIEFPLVISDRNHSDCRTITLKKPFVLPYVLGVLNSLGASRVFLAGFDAIDNLDMEEIRAACGEIISEAAYEVCSLLDVGFGFGMQVQYYEIFEERAEAQL